MKNTRCCRAEEIIVNGFPTAPHGVRSECDARLPVPEVTASAAGVP